MKTIKPNILALSEYIVDQDVDLIKLNQNESPDDIPSFLKQQVLERVESVGWNRYPQGDARLLIEAISAYTGHSENGIIAGNGSNEMIQTLVHCTCDSGHSILTVQPGFSVYARVAEVMNIKVIEVPLGVDFGFDTEALIANGQEARIMFLAVPNSPTGTILSLSQIRTIAENVPCIVAIDEAYFEFSGETAQTLISERDNIVILRSFSKAWQLAGLRLGYMLGPESLINECKKVKLPFSVGLFQQIAGEIILKNKSFFLDSAAKINLEKKRVFNELTKMDGIRAIPSHANFILFGTGSLRAKDVSRELYDGGVQVRFFDSERLRNMLRVTIGTPDENDFFLHTLKNVIGKRRNVRGTL